jgi:threonine dehydratase
MIAVTADAIRAAYARIPAEFRGMPQFVSPALSERIGRPVIIKAEMANPIGCFKGRGTWLAVADLAARGEVGERRGLVVASAGNFGQGVAYAARAHGVPTVIFAARNANSGKVDAMRRLGADVRLVGEDFDAAREAAGAFVAERDWRLLVDGQDPWITIGAGTLALELTDGVAARELPPLASIFIPVGNGALIGGVGVWFKAASSSTSVIGVQAERAPAMTLSWQEGRPITTEEADTVADGIAVRVPVPEALVTMRGVVDGMRLVDEASIARAAAELAACVPFNVEPSAGVGWAAATAEATGADDGAIGLILTGGNVAAAQA